MSFRLLYIPSMLQYMCILRYLKFNNMCRFFTLFRVAGDPAARKASDAMYKKRDWQSLWEKSKLSTGVSEGMFFGKEFIQFDNFRIGSPPRKVALSNGGRWDAGGGAPKGPGVGMVDFRLDTDMNSATNLGPCKGDCDADSQCAAGLKCMQRRSMGPLRFIWSLGMLGEQSSWEQRFRLECLMETGGGVSGKNELRG